MSGKLAYYSEIVLVLFVHFLCSGFEVEGRELEFENMRVLEEETRKEKFTFQISTTQMDVITPITTVPTITPANPTSSIPILNPNSNPDSSSPSVNITPNNFTPTNSSSSSTSTSSLGASWCVASQSASKTALQVALDYACGFGGIDCSAIQSGGSCYYPNSIRDHASYAFNAYFQKNPVPNSCNFGGTAITTNTNPSTGTCQFPSTSTSSSVLDTTSSSGSTVFGVVPSDPPPPISAATAISDYFPHVFFFTCLILLLLPI